MAKTKCDLKRESTAAKEVVASSGTRVLSRVKKKDEILALFSPRQIKLGCVFSALQVSRIDWTGVGVYQNAEK